MAASSSVSIPDACDSTSRMVFEIQKSNFVVDLDVDLFKPESRLMITVLKNSSLSAALTMSTLVPMAFVAEAVQSFAEIDENIFSFSVNGKRKVITKAIFIRLLKLSVDGDLHTPKKKEVFEVINEMGHIPRVNASSMVYISKLPEQWALLYTIVVNCFLGKVTSRWKINMNQMLMLYGFYLNVNVGIDEFVFSLFMSECKFRKVTEIVFHRYWSIMLILEVATST